MTTEELDMDNEAAEYSQDPTKERITSPEGGQREALGERWDLIPYEALREVAKVFHWGAVKYSDENWKRSPFADSEVAPINHALGHLNEAAALPLHGEARRLALAQAAANILMQLWGEAAAKPFTVVQYEDEITTVDPDSPTKPNVLERMKNKVKALTVGDE